MLLGRTAPEHLSTFTSSCLTTSSQWHPMTSNDVDLGCAKDCGSTSGWVHWQDCGSSGAKTGWRKGELRQVEVWGFERFPAVRCKCQWQSNLWSMWKCSRWSTRMKRFMFRCPRFRDTKSINCSKYGITFIIHHWKISKVSDVDDMMICNFLSSRKTLKDFHRRIVQMHCA